MTATLPGVTPVARRGIPAPDVEQIDVCGIPTLVGPPVEGQTRAGLTFRVGWADETLPLRGVTHLVQHLAGRGLPGGGHRHGEVQAHLTHFYLAGTEAEVGDFLTRVCAALRRLPLEHLEAEKQAIRAEDGAASYDPFATHRFGAEGAGLAGFTELGLGNLGPEVVAWWAQQWFTTQNAVLWVAGDLPDDLDLRLPQGVRRPQPTPRQQLTRPSRADGPVPGVGVTLVVDDGCASRVFRRVLDTALWTESRGRDGLSYQVGVEHERLGPGVGVLTAYADGGPEAADAVAGSVVDVLARLRWGSVTDDELTTAKQAERRLLDEPDPAAELPARAVSLLLGEPHPGREERAAEVDAVTAEDVRRIAAEAWESVLVVTPAAVDWAGLEPVARFSAVSLPGDVVPSPCPGTVPDLVIGPWGVAHRDGDREWSVPLATMVAYVVLGDGGRRAVGRDGTVIEIEPTLWRVPSDELEALEASLPHELVIELPARAPEDIPRAEPVAAPVAGSATLGGATVAGAATNRIPDDPVMLGPVVVAPDGTWSVPVLAEDGSTQILRGAVERPPGFFRRLAGAVGVVARVVEPVVAFVVVLVGLLTLMTLTGRTDLALGAVAVGFALVAAAVVRRRTRPRPV